MKVLSIDQAAHGGYAIWDFETQMLLEYGEFDFVESDYTNVVVNIANFVKDTIDKNDIVYVAFEDTMFQRNAQTLKNLCRIQGALIYVLESKDIPYCIIYPVSWQSYIKKYNNFAKDRKFKNTKELSLCFVEEQFDIKTDNNNVSDAICIGLYAIDHSQIE